MLYSQVEVQDENNTQDLREACVKSELVQAVPHTLKTTEILTKDNKYYQTMLSSHVEIKDENHVLFSAMEYPWVE